MGWCKKDITPLQSILELVQERCNSIANTLGLVQETHNSIANVLELRLSCTNPSISSSPARYGMSCEHVVENWPCYKNIILY